MGEKVNRFISCCALAVIAIVLYSTNVWADTKIKSELNEIIKNENVQITDFKELVNEYKKKGYEVFVIQLSDKYTMPQLIKNNDEVNNLKENALSLETINDETYPEIYIKYGVEKLISNDGREFLALIKYDSVKVIVPIKGGDVQVSVNNGRLIDVSDGEEIELIKGDIYDVTVYKNGNAIYSDEIDLVKFEGNEYKLKMKNNFSLIACIGVVLLTGIAIVIVKKRPYPEPNQPLRGAEILVLGPKVILFNDLLDKEEYGYKLEYEIIRKLQKDKDAVEIKITTIDSNNSDLQKYMNTYYLENKPKINIILSESNELYESLRKNQQYLNNLSSEINKFIRNIDSGNMNININDLRYIISEASSIYLGLWKIYKRAEDIIRAQSYANIISTKKEIAVNDIYVKECYSQMLNENYKAINSIYEFIKNEENERRIMKENMNSFTDYMVSAMVKLNDNFNEIHNEIKEEVVKISQDIRDNSLSITVAMKEFDNNVSKNVNSEFRKLKDQIIIMQSNESESKSNNIKELRKMLDEGIEKVIDNKMDNLESIVENLVERVNKEEGKSLNTVNVNKYAENLSETSLGYLRTGEYLYNEFIENGNVVLDDYSNIYIMYSKLIEAELYKCIKQGTAGINKDESLGRIVTALVKNDSKLWGKFQTDLKEKNIQKLRNHTAHNLNSGDGRITAEHVKVIRNFLLNDTINSIDKGWLCFIIKNRR